MISRITHRISSSVLIVLFVQQMCAEQNESPTLGAPAMYSAIWRWMNSLSVTSRELLTWTRSDYNHLTAARQQSEISKTYLHQPITSVKGRHNRTKDRLPKATLSCPAAWGFSHEVASTISCKVIVNSINVIVKSCASFGRWINSDSLDWQLRNSASIQQMIYTFMHEDMTHQCNVSGWII